MNAAITTLERIRQRLERRTTGAPIIREIDSLRFIAIALVFFHHANAYVSELGPIAVKNHGWGTPLGHVAHYGFFGVRLFFAISGLVLGLPFAQAHHGVGRPVSLGSYYKRRLTRLEPPYLANLVLVFLLLVVVKHAQLSSLWPHLLASATYSHSLIYREPSAINFVAWSLEVEVQFYVLMPLLAQIYRLRSATVRYSILMGAAVLAGALAVTTDTPYVRLTLLGHLPFFIVGLALADLHVTRGPLFGGRTTATWDAIGLLAWASMLPVMAADVRITALSTPPLVLAAYLGVFRGKYLSRLAQRAWPATIGGMCYTIYLYHGLCISMLGRIGIGRVRVGDSYSLTLAAQSTLYSVGVVVACAVFFVLLERPFMDRAWVARLTAAIRKRAVPDPAL